MSVKRGYLSSRRGVGEHGRLALAANLGLHRLSPCLLIIRLAPSAGIGGPQTWRMGWAMRAHAVRHRSYGGFRFARPTLFEAA